MPKRSSLGRGLAQLIPEAAHGDLESPRAALATAAVVQVPVEEIRANPMQPRRHFDEAALKELAASIREQGILQPILLRPSEGGYEIVAGERRYRAAMQAGLRAVPALVRKLDRSESLELALIENLQREDLNPVDEAEAYRSLIEQFGYTQEDLARRIGKDRSTVANVLRLLKLPEEVLDAISQGAISMGHGRALLALEEPERIREVFARVVAQSMSVRQVEEEVRRVLAGKKPRATVKDLPTPLLDLQDRLARRLGTRVRVRPRARGEGGKIVVEYYSRQDLDRLVDRMDAGPM
jgi:ParB family chromosome partitioning protein